MDGALTANGELSFKASTPDDADTDGDYEITVRVTDGANPVDASLVVRLSLSTVDGAAPVVSTTSPNGRGERNGGRDADGNADTASANGRWTDGGVDRAMFATVVQGDEGRRGAGRRETRR